VTEYKVGAYRIMKRTESTESKAKPKGEKGIIKTSILQNDRSKRQEVENGEGKESPRQQTSHSHQVGVANFDTVSGGRQEWHVPCQSPKASRDYRMRAQ